MATDFQGLILIDMVLPAWWIFDLRCQVGIGSFIVTMIFIVFMRQTMPGQYHYNLFFPCELRFLYLHTFIVKWLPCNKWFIQNQILQKCVSPEIEDIPSWICIVILNIILHWQDWCIFFRKHEVIIVNIFWMHTSWQWFMIVHNNMSPLNIFGELYCRDNFLCSCYYCYMSLFDYVIWW